VSVATLHNPTPNVDDRFGWSVAISGTRVVVGAIHDTTGGFRAGSAYLYNLGGATPTVPIVTLNNPRPSNWYFGWSVAISDTRVVVGATFNDLPEAHDPAAYMSMTWPATRQQRTSRHFEESHPVEA